MIGEAFVKSSTMMMTLVWLGLTLPAGAQQPLVD
jgi:hypothetical protein